MGKNPGTESGARFSNQKVLLLLMGFMVSGLISFYDRGYVTTYTPTMHTRNSGQGLKESHLFDSLGLTEYIKNSIHKE